MVLFIFVSNSYQKLEQKAIFRDLAITFDRNKNKKHHFEISQKLRIF
jgi:hypothetical protein